METENIPVNKPTVLGKHLGRVLHNFIAGNRTNILEQEVVDSRICSSPCAKCQLKECRTARANSVLGKEREGRDKGCSNMRSMSRNGPPGSCFKLAVPSRRKIVNRIAILLKNCT
jgi:hypothetical protein